MSEQKHTPLPWRAVANGHVLGHKNGPPSWDVLAANPPDFVCDRLTEANATFIEQACNAHDALLEACKAVLEAINRAEFGGVVLWINPPYQAAGVHESAAERLEAAIARAEAKA